MGVHWLASFMEKKFKGLKIIDSLPERVIIDGNNVCYKLYSENFAWGLGGEYDQFRTKVIEFLDEFKQPIVVIDGPDDPKKKNLICERRNGYIEEMYSKEVSVITGTCNGDLSDKGLVPLLALQTFISVLIEKNIKFYVADGEADREIVALANHYKCPVVSSDSDFFIFNLKYGFIYIDKQFKYRKYELKSFKKQFKLEDYDLCLLIPVVLGNDLIKKVDNDLQKIEKPDDLSIFLEKLSKYGTCEFYLQSVGNEKIKKGYTAAKSFYADVQLPDYYKPAASPQPPEYCGLPEWIYSSFKSGNFPVGVLGAYRHNFCVLPRVVEATSQESGWKVSQYIRERIYHIMGISTVNEVIRTGYKVGDESVHSKSLKTPVSVKDKLFKNKDHPEITSDLVLAILGCHKMPQDTEFKFSTLSEELKLPIAATFYWYRNTNATKEMVIALLLTFMEFNVPESLHFDQHRIKLESLLPHTTPPNYLEALHIFAQWQCVYYDAMSLNFLAREPFLTTSPACLYSGGILMFHTFVSSKDFGWPSSIIAKEKDWNLFSKLLYLVTGRKEARKAYCATSPIYI